MPFGLSNAPATFQRLMDRVLEEYIGKFVVVYIDDINIYSKTFDKHLGHLKKVFDKLAKAGLKINVKKCDFFKSTIHFLGHLVGRQGIQPGFATLARPLHYLLTTAPILKYPDFDNMFYLYTDASGTGVGAVLAQKGDGKKEHLIFYASRSLSKAERNYSSCELECLAVIWAVEYYHHYFGFRPFTIITDYSALKWLHSTKLKGRRARWILRLQPYNYMIQHRSGSTHTNADALSRINSREEKIVEVYMAAENGESRSKGKEEENRVDEK